MSNKALIAASVCVAALASTVPATGMAAMATTLALWNFNFASIPAPPPFPPPIAEGEGTLSLVGGTVPTPSTPFFSSGICPNCSSDPAVGQPPDYAYRIQGFAAPGQQNKGRGIQFAVDTTGYENIGLSYDVFQTNASSRYSQVQYSTDGVSFTDIGALFSSTTGNSWSNGRSIDLSSIAGVDNNPNFAFRIVAAFAPGTNDYVATAPGTAYNSIAQWRFDMVSVTGTEIPPAVIPVPAALPLFLSAVAGLAAFRSRSAA